MVLGTISRSWTPGGPAIARPGLPVGLDDKHAPAILQRARHIIPISLVIAGRSIYYRANDVNIAITSASLDAIWFQQALERAGASQADLARHLRLAPSAISRLLKGERQMKLLEAVQVAAFLGVPQEEVLARAGAAAPSAHRGDADRGEPSRRGRPPRATLSHLPMSAPSPTRHDQIPIRSAARGGGEQAMFLQDGPIGYTPCPANLGGVRGAYAIYMVGDSMEPRYEQGWLLHVNPFKPPIRGRDVVVYKTDEAVLIKQFVRWDNDVLVLRQLNPAADLRIPRAEVRECHLVVGVDQEG